jgi:DNA helicase-2/ATP-dependent DNA helicase PcrA
MALNFSKEKKNIIYEKKGCFVVRACPGSGKTLIVAARFARLLAEWKLRHQGIAAISFTNVAWEEIQNYLEKEDLINEFGRHTPIGYPHFLGTIDSFINTFLFLPFGHLVMRCDERPQFIGPPHNNYEPIENEMWWNNYECKHYRCELNDFSYDEKGNVISYAPGGRNHFSKCATNPKICIKFKKKLNESGRATQLDANYFALKILRALPVIAKALVKRFPVFLIDEAQDTSTIQMMILDILLENGLSEVMLVGDPDQAIYEWRTANPKLFQGKYDIWSENSLELNENWRSTRSICAFADKISSLNKPMLPKEPELSEYDSPPAILGYEGKEELPRKVHHFVTKCKSMGIDENKIHVLTRSNMFWKEVLPGSVPKYDLSPWKPKKGKRDEASRNLIPMEGAQRIAKSRFLFDQGEFKEAFHLLEQAVCMLFKKLKVARKADLDETINKWGGLAKWRGDIYNLLKMLPETNCVLSKWVDIANRCLQAINWLSNYKFLIITQGKYKDEYANLSFDQLFIDPKFINRGAECYFGTVHSVKGQTLDAVMLVLKEKAADGKSYYNLLRKDRKEGIRENEELRIVYVALTRARKILFLAVPNECLDVWNQKFFPEDFESSASL